MCPCEDGTGVAYVGTENLVPYNKNAYAGRTREVDVNTRLVVEAFISLFEGPG